LVKTKPYHCCVVYTTRQAVENQNDAITLCSQQGDATGLHLLATSTTTS